MALWKDQSKPTPSAAPTGEHVARFDTPAAEPKPEFVPTASAMTASTTAHAPRDKAQSESVIAPDITIEGKIEGAGHVRIAGRFKGDVIVQGNLSIDSGAHVTGSVRADKVSIAGELVGNIETASHVELMQTGALTGDLKAKSLAVAAGSRMRGQADFGWNDAETPKAVKKNVQANGSDHDVAK